MNKKEIEKAVKRVLNEEEAEEIKKLRESQKQFEEGKGKVLEDVNELDE